MNQSIQESKSSEPRVSLTRLGGNRKETALFVFGRESVEHWSFEQLDATAGRIAAGLRREGLEPEAPVALLAPPSAPYIAVALGILRAGGTVVPIDAQMPDKGLLHALGDSRPIRLFTDERGAHRLEKLNPDEKPMLLRLDSEDGDDAWRSIDADEAAAPETSDPESRAVLFYTSGTTGPPKGVPLSRRNVAYQFKVLLDSGLIRDGDRMLLPLPLHHVYPFVCGLLAPLHAGLPVVLPSALTGPELVRAIRESQASVVIGVPRLHRALVDGIRQRAEHSGMLTRIVFRAALRTSRGARKRLGLRLGRLLFGSLHRRLGGNVRLMASGGSPLDPNLARQLEAFGWNVAIGYGLTETSPLLTILSPGDPRFDTVGRPVNGTQLKIDTSSRPGDESNPDANGDRDAGEILARGPGVFAGYHGLTEETEKAFSDGWFRTGDFGRIDADGYVTVHGRVSTMLVLEGGENIAPETLEEVYADCDEIDEAGIIQREGKLVALLVPNESVPQSNAREHVSKALERISRNLPSYQRLSAFKLSGRALPRTRMGKIRRHELAERFESEDKDSDASSPKGPIPIEEMSSEDQSLLDNEPARKLWNFLSERYADHRLEPESRLDSDLGIDSMEWVELTGTAEERLGISLGEEVIERARTVHDLLEAAAGGGKDRSPGDTRRALKDPESVLSETDLRWIEPRSTFHEVIGRPLYWMHEALMRGLFRVELRGRENLPEQGPYVLTPNHVSYLDGSALIAAFDFGTIRTFFWAGLTDALFKNRFWRALSRLGQVVPIDPRRGPLSSLAFGAAVLKRGAPLVWFPEGGRSPNGELRPFRPGLGLILEQHPAPVLPVYIKGTYAALPPGRAIPKPGKIIVRIGKPIHPDELARQGKGDSTHERITNALHDAVERMRKEAE